MKMSSNCEHKGDVFPVVYRILRFCKTNNVHPELHFFLMNIPFSFATLTLIHCQWIFKWVYLVFVSIFGRDMNIELGIFCVNCMYVHTSEYTTLAKHNIHVIALQLNTVPKWFGSVTLKPFNWFFNSFCHRWFGCHHNHCTSHPRTHHLAGRWWRLLTLVKVRPMAGRQPREGAAKERHVEANVEVISRFKNN